MYKGSRERFEELVQRAEREEASLEGLLLWQVIKLASPQTQMLAIGGKFVACTQGAGQGTALLWPAHDSESGALIVTVRLYHPAMGDECIVSYCSDVSSIKEMLESIAYG